MLSVAVPDYGSRAARLVLIGEAPGSQEMLRRTPFVGPSGKLLERWWAASGLSRRDFYITNTVGYQPRGKVEALSRAELDDWIAALHDRLAKLDDPWLIVPTGAVALEALTGKHGILKHRGSVYSYTDNRGRVVKVIPTVHPAATFREPSLEKACRADWARIAADSQFRELRLPERAHYINPSLDDVRWFVDEVAAHGRVLSVDIETPRRETWTPTVLKSGKPGKPKRSLGEPYIACVGFSFDPAFAMCIPTTAEYWGSEGRCRRVWGLVQQLCQDPVTEKVLQNGGFDTWWLEREQSIRMVNYRWDCKAMHHCLDPTDSHSLAYMASVDTRQQFWKDEAKDPDEIMKYASNQEAFFTYNCLDVEVQRELYDVYERELQRRGLLGTYIQHYRNLFWPLLQISLHGLAVDSEMRAVKEAEFKAEISRLRSELSERTGTELYGKTSLSPTKLAAYLYGTPIKQKCPTCGGRKAKAGCQSCRQTGKALVSLPQSLRLPKQMLKGKLTTREVAVRKLMLKFPDKLGVTGQLILDQRRTQQLVNFVKESRVDPDGRMRSSYGFSPETGRLSSTRAPNRRGCNAQNQDREILEMYKADEGCVLLEADYSQGESRIVDVLTQDRVLVDRAYSKPWERDVHRETAAIVFRVPLRAVTDLQRELGKRAKHAGNYDVHGKTFSEELSKDGYTFTPEECEAWIQQAVEPAIRHWQRRIRMELMRHRKLVSPFGCTISFPYERLDSNLYRRGYAWKPQHTLAKMLNLFGMVPLARWLAREAVPARVNANIHDALKVSVPPEWAYDVAEFMGTSMSQPLDIEGIPLAIPVEYKVGLRGGGPGTVKLKRLPSREEFDRVVASVMDDSTAVPAAVPDVAAAEV